jgi:hypothetical protein
MRTTQALFFSGFVLVGVGGLSLSQDKSSPGAQPKPAPPASSLKTNMDYPVVGYLEKRGQTITIKAGPKGPLYSVKMADGKVLCENLSQEQLTAQAPELGEFLKTAMAGMPGVKMDARVRVIGDARIR